MTLEIKRTLDSVVVKDLDVRNAIADYVHKHTGRELETLQSPGIKFHPTNHHEDDRVSRHCDTLYVTVQLKDQVPTADSTETRPAKTGGLTRTKIDVKNMLRRMDGRDFKVEPRDIQTLRNVVVLLGRLDRTQGEAFDDDSDPGEIL
ncbi:hypothetical protein AXY1_29 [Achromobacter phage AXY1]|nr:hypothetical protein AXY1_29 [Achromobacter phage AXY1]